MMKNWRKLESIVNELDLTTGQSVALLAILLILLVYELYSLYNDSTDKTTPGQEQKSLELNPDYGAYIQIAGKRHN